MKERRAQFEKLFGEMGIDPGTPLASHHHLIDVATLQMSSSDEKDEAIDGFTAEMLELNEKLRSGHDSLKTNIERSSPFHCSLFSFL